MAVPVPPTGLPVEEAVEPLRHALADRGVAVLQAEPGAGKTTVVPLRLLDEPWLGGKRIVVLEPRRLATRAAGRRMADLLAEAVGATVGYRTRDERHVGKGTRIEVVTEGILTRRLQADPSLPGTALVVFDEVHERHLQTDLALALALDARRGLRPDLRILAMSATLEASRLASLLGGGGEPAPVVTSPGRTHPVDIRWRPRGPRDRPLDAVAAAVHAAVTADPGDVLVFLPGAAAIRTVGSLLRDLPDDVDVRPLHGSLRPEDQDRALAPSPAGRRRVVLSTDIAESSLTVEGVRIVVDGGEVRRPRHDARSGLSRLQTTAASKASADQRAGRAGRLGPGVAYRLWGPGEHATRRAHAEPEIRSADLADLALELAVWGATADELPFLDPPPPTALADAGALLHQLGAVDDAGRPTPDGRAMVDLPLHPRLARMVVDDRSGLACVLASLLEERDPLRGRPEELEADIVERVRLVVDPKRRHPRLDDGARQTVRRRSRELARRAGIGDRGPTTVDAAAVGPVLALAYPDRIGQNRGRGRFRLRSGRGVAVADHDPLANEAFLVVADLMAPARDQVDDRIRLAAALDEADVERVAGAEVVEARELVWNDRGELEERRERRLDALVLRTSSGAATPGPATTAALVDRVRDDGLALLGWTDKSRALQERAGFARRFLGDAWPDVSDKALQVSVDDWLAPLLGRATSARDLRQFDVLTGPAGPARPPGPRAGPGGAGQGDRGQRTGGDRGLRHGPTVDQRPGPGALRDEHPPHRGRRAGAAHRGGPVPRRAAHPGHRRPPRVLGGIVGGRAQGHDQRLPEARLARRPGGGDPDDPGPARPLAE